MSQLGEEKKIWQSRRDTLKEQYDGVNKKIRELASEEKEWKGKQQGYKGEVNRWQKEVERQQKISDSYNSLAEVK
jgi:predicted  nucleic acid-binding Zn-ribbon protein